MTPTREQTAAMTRHSPFCPREERATALKEKEKSEGEREKKEREGGRVNEQVCFDRAQFPGAVRLVILIHANRDPSCHGDLCH